MSKVTEAEKSIAKILRDIELETGCLVKSIELDKIDITQIQDERPQHMMHVHIELERLPGHKWGVQ